MTTIILLNCIGSLSIPLCDNGVVDEKALLIKGGFGRIVYV